MWVLWLRHGRIWLPPGGDGRRRRAQIRELEKLGRRSGPVFHDGCLLRLQQSQRAMEFLQLKVRFGSFVGVDRRWRGGRPLVDLEGSRASMFFSCFSGSFVLFGLNRCLCIPWVHVCICMYLCTLFLNMKYRYVLSKKKLQVGIYDELLHQNLACGLWWLPESWQRRHCCCSTASSTSNLSSLVIDSLTRTRSDGYI